MTDKKKKCGVCKKCGKATKDGRRTLCDKCDYLDLDIKKRKWKYDRERIMRRDRL